MGPSSLTFFFVCFYRSHVALKHFKNKQTNPSNFPSPTPGTALGSLWGKFLAALRFGGRIMEGLKEVSLKEHLPVRVAFGSLCRMGAPSCSTTASWPQWAMCFLATQPSLPPGKSHLGKNSCLGLCLDATKLILSVLFSDGTSKQSPRAGSKGMFEKSPCASSDSQGTQGLLRRVSCVGLG